MTGRTYPWLRDHESELIVAVQHVAAGQPWSRVATATSAWGEHALGWIAISMLGGLVDSSRRRQWLLAGTAAVVAHGAAVGLKRVVRRSRPTDPRIAVLVSTPSSLSFPSAHVASTAAFCVAAQGNLFPLPLTAATTGVMGASRVLLGVHFPSDVAVGCALGVATGLVARTLIESAS